MPHEASVVHRGLSSSKGFSSVHSLIVPSHGLTVSRRRIGIRIK